MLIDPCKYVRTSNFHFYAFQIVSFIFTIKSQVVRLIQDFLHMVEVPIAMSLRGFWSVTSPCCDKKGVRNILVDEKQLVEIILS